MPPARPPIQEEIVNLLKSNSSLSLNPCSVADIVPDNPAPTKTPPVISKTGPPMIMIMTPLPKVMTLADPAMVSSILLSFFFSLIPSNSFIFSVYGGYLSSSG